MQLNISHLLAHTVPVQEKVGDCPAYAVGLGSNAGENLELRKLLKKPGPPFGGLGFLDPTSAVAEFGADAKLPSDITVDSVRFTKLKEFMNCADGKPSVYFWALQPIVNTWGDMVSAEILVRAKNGSDSAPFEDLTAIMDPTAAAEVRDVYIAWKATEVVDWTLNALKEFPILQSLDYITTNVRPMDLPTKGPLFQEVSKRINALSEEDRELVLQKVIIEVTEDQMSPEDLEHAFEAWKELGFRLAYDDTTGEKVCEMLAKKDMNFHTTTELEPILQHFSLLKVDIDWAGYAIFLSHPSYSSRPALKAEVLCHARDEDLVYVPQGPGLKNTGYKHSVMLEEFAKWSMDMITRGKPICIELSVSQDDENNALALSKLKGMGLDIFGVHRASFSFQGGPTGAKAFQPNVLVTDAKICQPGKLAKGPEEELLQELEVMLQASATDDGTHSPSCGSNSMESQEVRHDGAEVIHKERPHGGEATTTTTPNSPKSVGCDQKPKCNDQFGE